MLTLYHVIVYSNINVCESIDCERRYSHLIDTRNKNPSYGNRSDLLKLLLLSFITTLEPFHVRY